MTNLPPDGAGRCTGLPLLDKKNDVDKTFNNQFCSKLGVDMGNTWKAVAPLAFSLLVTGCAIGNQYGFDPQYNNLNPSTPQIFPWPPIRPTKQYYVPKNRIPNFNTVEEASEYIVSILQKHGYKDISFGRIDNTGVAIVTQIERIDQYGIPLDGNDRWADIDSALSLSFHEYTDALLFGAEQRCRVLLFFLTDKQVAPQKANANIDLARDWTHLGGSIPVDLMNVPFTDKYNLSVFEYRYNRKSGAQPEFVASADGQLGDYLSAIGF